METRADNGRIDNFCSKLGHNWVWAAIVAEGYLGGILVIWQKQLGKVTLIAISRYVLHVVVTSAKNETWILSTIYNPSRIQDQSSVYLELTNIASINFPWILIGDFNSTVSLNDFQGGPRSYYRRKARIFSDFIITNNLLEVNFTGSKFT